MFTIDRIVIFSVCGGLLLIMMALANSLLKRIPVSSAIIYLLVGYGLGLWGDELLRLNPLEHAHVLERVAEVALLVSLFSAGLKLRQPLRDSRWRLSARLAVLTMIITIACIAALAFALGLNLSAAILLGAILAPTDPVLAADLRVENTLDNDRLRFSLTGESGLNDATALPFVVLGLSLLAAPTAPNLWQWFTQDVLWSFGSGIAIGGVCGYAVGHMVLYLRTEQKEAVGLDEFLVLGLIAVVYGVALALHASTFLAVFAAGLAVTRTTDITAEPAILPAHELEALDDLATEPEHAGPLMMRAVIGFNEQLERLAEVTVVSLVGVMLSRVAVDYRAMIIVIALLVIIRPLAVNLSLFGKKTARKKMHIYPAQRLLISWFGIRGIGSVYYLFYAINRDLPRDMIGFFIATTLLVVATSIVLHGISVTPLMNYYEKNTKNKR